MTLDLLRALVAAPSPTGQEGPAVDVMDEWLRRRGVPILRVDRNIAAFREGASAGPTLLLCSHLDTVPPTASWTRPPFQPTLENGHLFGLGANDAKASVAAMSVAFATAAVRRGRLILAATCEEETGRNGLEAFLPRLPRPDSAIVGEPTGLDIAVAQSGMLILDCMAEGRSGHAARPQLADNAIYKAAADVIRLERLDLDRIHPRLGKTTHSVTILKGGERHNVIPDRCSFTVDLRTTPAYTHDELADIVQASITSKVTVRSGRYRSAETPEHALVLAAARRARPAARLFCSPTVSDWAHLRGVHAIKWGPGLSEVSHTADEWVNVAMVDEAAEAYARVIEELLG